MSSIPPPKLLLSRLNCKIAVGTPTYKYKGGRRKRHISYKLSKAPVPPCNYVYDKIKLTRATIYLYVQNSKLKPKPKLKPK